MKKCLSIIMLLFLSEAIFGQVSYVLKSHSFTKPDTIVLENTSQNLASFKWLFPGSTTPESFDNIVTVIYDTPGIYSFSLVGEDDQTGKLDTLTQKDFIQAPGFLSPSQVVVCGDNTLQLKADGGSKYAFYKIYEQVTSNWSSSGIYTDIKPETVKYIAAIKDASGDFTYYDTVSVIHQQIVDGIILKNDTYCNGDKTKLIVPEIVASYNVSEYVNNEWIQQGNFTPLKPYYVKGMTQVKFDWIDTLGCSWSQENYLGENVVYPPVTSVYDQTICSGTSAELNPGTSVPFAEWIYKKEVISTDFSLNVSDSGMYVLKAWDSDKICFSLDTCKISFYDNKPDSITSISYLPGIGYALTYSRIQDAASYEFWNIENLVDAMPATQNGETAYPLVIDTVFASKNPQYVMTTINGCNSAVPSKKVQPIELNAEKDLDGNMFLSWTPYTVSPVQTYVIFRGTSVDNMQVLYQISSNTVLQYIDVDPPQNAIYAIGVKDFSNANAYYKDMLFAWQKGYVTSNLSPLTPDLKKYRRIGVFAIRQIDGEGERFFKAYYPNVEKIEWTFENFEENNVNVGAAVMNSYFHKDSFDVKVKVSRPNFADSVYLKDFVVVGDPIYFNVDTIIKKLGNDTIDFDISKTIQNNVLGYTDKKVDWYLDSPDNMQPGNMYIAKEFDAKGNDRLRIWVNPQLGETEFPISINGLYQDFYSLQKKIVVKVISSANKPPYLINIGTLPEVIANSKSEFEPFDLTPFVSDDYTPLNKLTWSINENAHLSFSVINGQIQAIQKDLNWTGTEFVTITVTDENGMSSMFEMKFTQPYLKQVPTHEPIVSFKSNKLYIKPYESVTFYAQMQNTDSVRWSFDGGNPMMSTKMSPIVKYDSAGKYTVTLTAINNLTKKVITKPYYITVSALSKSDTTICKGESLKIEVLIPGFDSYIWNTDPQTNAMSITVTPTQTTTYKVIMKKGLVTLTDQVTITIPKQPNLGSDTTFCEGGNLSLTPGQFNSYYWNGSTIAGSATFVATEPGIYTVKVQDALNCISSDTVEITPLYKKPIVSLGKDTSFCWKKTLVVDAQNAANLICTYKWSDDSKLRYLNVDTTGTYSVTVTDAHECTNVDTINIHVKVPVIPSIGLLTQSSKEKNLIAWEPLNNKGIALYHVWRENKSGIFEIIDTIQKGDTTVSIDNSSTPKTASFRYALSTVDSACGNESHLSSIHASMLLKCILINEKTVKVSWNQYQGISVDSYIIYRAMKGQKLEPIDTVDAVKTTMQQEYLDTTALGMGSYYQIRFNLSQELTPSKLKSDSGPFSQSLSNLAESELTGTDVQNSNQLVLYPNPAQKEFMIESGTSSVVTITLYDVLGRAVKQLNGTGKINVDCSDLMPGMFIVHVLSNNQITTKSVIIEK